MIIIQDKKDCCGCSACVQRCPKHCIGLNEDEEGFLYPEVDESLCIGCGLCEKACPVINQSDEREPLGAFAAINPNEEVRAHSSSGGVFTMRAEAVIDEGGAVFGACFNERWALQHSYAETREDLAKYRISKYLQSKAGKTFQQAEQFLKKGRKVLYCGTPCQIAGLRRFLRKEYDNLLTVDFICHGVPSPGVFRTYVRDLLAKAAHKGSGVNTVLPCIPLAPEKDWLNENGMEVKSVCFRDKRNGWKKYGFAIVLSKAPAAGEKNRFLSSYEHFNENAFMRGFLRDLYIRPSCYACPAKKLKSGSDITLGDFWGIETLKPEIDDGRGVSAVTVNTARGNAAMKGLGANLYPLPYEELTKRNPALVRSAAIPKNRDEFFKEDGKTFEEKIRKLARAEFSLQRMIIGCCSRLLPAKSKTTIRQMLKRKR